MKRLVIVVALVCALSGTVLAGEIPSGDAPAPPPPSPVVKAILTIIRAVAR